MSANKKRHPAAGVALVEAVSGEQAQGRPPARRMERLRYCLLPWVVLARRAMVLYTIIPAGRSRNVRRSTRCNWRSSIL
jgi:hypothetical protein